MGDYSGVEELTIIEKYLKNYNHDLVLKLSEFLKNKEQLLQENIEILGCKPDCSDAYIQLQKLIKDNPDDKSKYWLAYHRLNEIVNTFY